MGRDLVPVPTPEPERQPRKRHDGFTPEKRKRFLKALKKSGCIADAARVAGISCNTVRRHRDRFPDFAALMESALAIASVELDMIAWQRATVGTEEKVYRDGRLVFTRVKPSDAMLRMLMQGANPKRYGRTGQMPRAAVKKRLRKEVEAEVRSKLTATPEETEAAILKQLDVMNRRLRAQGYSEGPDGILVPPGWRVVRD
jgi:hypothetical protein